MATSSSAPVELVSRAKAEPLRLAPLQRALALWHLTSLDAPTVAVVWALAFARAGGVHLPWWVPAGLALCAWSVYIGDRLLDAHRANRRPRLSRDESVLAKPEIDESLIDNLRPRHFFHWRHRKVLLPLAATAALIAIAMLLRYMPVAVRERNSVLAVAALAYFTSVHSPWRMAKRKFRLPKEFLVGVLFTAACAIPTWARMPQDFAQKLAFALTVIVFIALAWLNCEAIERWESGLGSRTIFRLALMLGGSALAAAAITTALHQRGSAVLLVTAALGAVSTALLDHASRRMHPTTVRAVADLVLLAPALLTPVLLLFAL